MTSINTETFPAWWHERAQLINKNARDKGFWEKERNDAEMFDLVHSEVSEAVEALWRKNPPAPKIPDFTCFEEELADAVIRLMDQTYARNWNVVPLVLYYDSNRSWFEKEIALDVRYPLTEVYPELVLLKIHYTLSMALEELRHSKDPSVWIAKTLVLLFRLGLAGGEDYLTDHYRPWDLYGAIDAKMAYNTGRPYKHGKNF
jgi:NTP pyrophosphatase (non-canonical NTP hydrolase)